MATAQRIVSSHTTETFADQQKLESELREFAIRIDGPNCYDRIYYFFDGSKVTKTRTGFVAG